VRVKVWAILLQVMYDSREKSLRSVRPIVEGLRARGYRFVTVRELLEFRRRDRLMTQGPGGTRPPGS